MTTTASSRKQAAGIFAATALMGIAALLATPHGARAQGGAKGGATGVGAGGAAQIPRTQAEFEKQLGITAAQKTKIEAIKKKYEPKAKVLQTQVIALQKQLQAMGMQANKEMQAILTTAQKNKIKALQAQQAAMMQQQQGGGGMMGGPPPMQGGGSGGGKMR